MNSCLIMRYDGEDDRRRAELQGDLSESSLLARKDIDLLCKPNLATYQPLQPFSVWCYTDSYLAGARAADQKLRIYLRSALGVQRAPTLTPPTNYPICAV
ncbi:hypothetical protein K443DRAFT_513722 [Laccaria amethystina LaAM-08-1]|uniref:Uncharacterized protein n=1 Tax=Laccaria amethystina LaAM-08-1 TaxID=1095629 RepID=A0A0C9XCK3_9AGAR|nr:hypothetical protein K443DRAFT_513722 [Laccaria amethystina LaAM-08-1]